MKGHRGEDALRGSNVWRLMWEGVWLQEEGSAGQGARAESKGAASPMAACQWN